LGAVLMLLSLVQAIYTLVIYFSPQRSTLPPGWPTLMFFVLLNGGLQLFMLGIVAHYIGFIFDEVKRRPLYVVRRVHGRIP
jgi:polyisoprenyl-phosphate glycosyltransferase